MQGLVIFFSALTSAKFSTGKKKKSMKLKEGGEVELISEARHLWLHYASLSVRNGNLF